MATDVQKGLLLKCYAVKGILLGQSRSQLEKQIKIRNRKLIKAALAQISSSAFLIIPKSSCFRAAAVEGITPQLSASRLLNVKWNDRFF